jgi:hypothetical protein
MDSNVNPLHALPPAQRFQVMAYLGTMWTTIFCGAAGAWLWYGELVTLHVLVAAGFLVTGLTFANAAPTETYRDRPLEGIALVVRQTTLRRGPMMARCRPPTGSAGGPPG